MSSWFGSSSSPSLADIDVSVLGGTPQRSTVETPPSTSSWSFSLGSMGKLPFLAGAEEDTSILGGLSWTKRMMIFVVLLGVGAFFLFTSMFFLLNLRQFAKFYTLGTLSIISSMIFLVGPTKLFKSMFDASRFVASIAYFGTVIIQLASSLWYGGSYIPFAQTLLRSTASTLLPI